MSKPILLVDGRNALYRAIHAGHADRVRRPASNHDHFFTIFLRQFSRWISNCSPSSINVFWDTPRATVWRKDILPTYKERSQSDYSRDISGDLKKITGVAIEFFKAMNVRQFYKERMEADDLIYAAATVLHPRDTVIISSDSDMAQIPFMVSSCTVIRPDTMESLPATHLHPAYMKALIGDRSDAIDGYYGIGPKRGAILLENPDQFQEFLKVKEPATFNRNLSLIDLSLCPFLLKNRMYVQRTLVAPILFCKEEINRLIKHHKVSGLLSELPDLVMPFSQLK